MEQEFNFSDVSSQVYNAADVNVVENMFVHGDWVDRDYEKEQMLIKIAVRQNNIPMLEMFAQYFDFQFDRRPLMMETNNMETIRWLANLGYDDDDILNKLRENIEKGDDKDLKFYMNNLVEISQDDMNELLDLSAGFDHIYNILQEYRQKFFD